MSYQSINPYNAEFLRSYEVLTDPELDDKINLSISAYNDWSKLYLADRLRYFPLLEKLIKEQAEHHATLISLEMGKPISQSRAEIEKCISACNYYYKNAENLLKPEKFESFADESYVVYEPMGIVYGIMPWNFPYWQVFRFLIPNLILGNTLLLKHASNVPQCAENIEILIHEAGFPEGVFQNLFINYKQSEKVIAHSSVRGITLTGSESAGSKIAAIAGKHIKKTVLELGGSDPFILLEDAEPDKIIEKAVFARMQNAGQSCIAAKRFFIHEKIYDEFIEQFTAKVNSIRTGDPLDTSTEMGPMAADYLVAELDMQVQNSIKYGARLITGGKRSSKERLFYEPTIIETELLSIPVCEEETFGPVAVVIKYNDTQKMIDMANRSCFGLGASIWSGDIERAKFVANRIESGMVTINGIVKSDPALPFGGTKNSGYGRELAAIGFKEFANAKTVVIHY